MADLLQYILHLACQLETPSILLQSAAIYSIYDALNSPLPAPSRTALPAQLLWPTGFLCGWLVCRSGIPCGVRNLVNLLAVTVDNL